MYETSKQKDFFWGAIVGGTIATLTALLFTTQTGRRLQRQIGNVYDDIEDSIKDTFHEAKDKVENTKEDMYKKVPHHRSKHEEHVSKSKHDHISPESK